nr:L-type lectin-domain containing receptor kinase IX.1-like isoform X2 [Physcomitrium patens]|eukprot:XP_024386592.1 L-type lectin-domain containing receptor kinase IX.1-like isoform X2 [Physcomitrella patens]
MGFYSGSVLLLVWTSWALLANSMTMEEFSIKEKNVRRLGDDALHLAMDTEECGLSLCVDNCARHACSASHNDNFLCANTFRSVADCEALNPNKTCLQLQLNFGKNGFVRIPPPFRNYSNANLRPEIKRAICSHSNLQFTASSKINLTFWNYFGSAEGVWRSYPGRVAEPDKGCISYDPRKRPWYILATAVVKDLILLLDIGQERDTTLKLAVNVVSELFDTLRINDTVNMVTFDSVAATPISPNSILVNEKNSKVLRTVFKVSKLSKSGNPAVSNLTLGFDKARAMFNPKSKLKIILVFTDGHFSKNPVFINEPSLQRAVANLNADNVIVFFFSIGPGESDNPPDTLQELRTLSCQMNSSVVYVSEADAFWNPLWAIRPYFDYQAKMRFRENVTFWTDTYIDFDGLGEVSTVTYPVFQDGTLYGVAGIDVFVNASDNAIIQQKAVNPNVPAIELECEEENVNLSHCTKAVDPGLQPLCEQDVYLNEDPKEVYKKLLCCDTCAVQDVQKRNLLPVYLAVAGTSVFAIILMLIIAVLGSKYRIARKFVREIQEDFARASISTNLYTYKELKKATRNFHNDNKLGEGGFGEVFLGKIRDGSQVAVKKLADDSKQGKPQFLAEVMIISKVQHRNLVKLRGCCVEGRHRLLVYEYLENKSLRETLLGTTEELIHIDWPTRFNIATGTARGLAYLHDEINPRIIHRDIKASNILLDGHLEAKISDFGLAKLCPDERTHLTTAIAGTLGYMAPEITRGQLSEKVDVFSYGVLLMEIVTGKVTMSVTNFGTPFCLVDEVRDLYRKSQETGRDDYLLRLVDRNLHGVFNKEEVIRVLKIALICANDNPASRPSITQVISMLLEHPNDFSS